ncbi:MAG: ATP-grasp domain-containing protein [Streptosporangiales bacterium]|nr:ATP-grasp domain-containing protein [Streptosporangiales bacterium]
MRPVLRRVLIANRGEIAVRILRTCERLGIEAVLAASEADLDSLPARLADRTICIGPASSSASYLDVEAVVGAALAVEADAIHPGYGFLSENPRLARACDEAGVVFVGPTEAQLAAAGDKLRARDHAVAAGLPVMPGGEVRGVTEARELAEDIGFPVLVKAVGGGGGRGLKPVHDPHGLTEAVERAMAEARAAFGDPRVYLERLVRSGRHVEVQLLGDGETVIQLGDRDCSVQRRYQKLVEEAPAPDLGDRLRAEMHRAAVAFGERLGYRGIGTVEFLVDLDRDTFHFLEMNARVQVEHPVTEEVVGLDLVAEQIAIAEGRPVTLAQSDVRTNGHAIECRINAEDWRRGFRPSPGTVTEAVFPAGPGIRVDTHVQAGSAVPPFYDSLVAKLIVCGRDRGDAVARLADALDRCRVDGITTNLPLHRALCADPEFAGGGADIALLDRFLEGVGAARG